MAARLWQRPLPRSSGTKDLDQLICHRRVPRLLDHAGCLLQRRIGLAADARHGEGPERVWGWSKTTRVGGSSKRCWPVGGEGSGC